MSISLFILLCTLLLLPLFRIVISQFLRLIPPGGRSSAAFRRFRCSGRDPNRRFRDHSAQDFTKMFQYRRPVLFLCAEFTGNDHQLIIAVDAAAEILTQPFFCAFAQLFTFIITETQQNRPLRKQSRQDGPADRKRKQKQD